MFDPKEILEVAVDSGCEWAMKCECGHPKIDHDDKVGCLVEDPSASPGDPPQVEGGFDYEICRCIVFRPLVEN